MWVIRSRSLRCSLTCRSVLLQVIFGTVIKQHRRRDSYRAISTPYRRRRHRLNICSAARRLQEER